VGVPVEKIIKKEIATENKIHRAAFLFHPSYGLFRHFSLSDNTKLYSKVLS
jgi:ADP-ribosylglycohydrolase